MLSYTFAHARMTARMRWWRGVPRPCRIHTHPIPKKAPASPISGNASSFPAWWRPNRFMDAFEVMMDSLRSSGSQIVAGRAADFYSGPDKFLTYWTTSSSIYSQKKQGLTVESCPDLILDHTAWIRSLPWTLSVTTLFAFPRIPPARTYCSVPLPLRAHLQ